MRFCGLSIVSRFLLYLYKTKRTTLYKVECTTLRPSEIVLAVMANYLYGDILNGRDFCMDGAFNCLNDNPAGFDICIINSRDSRPVAVRFG